MAEQTVSARTTAPTPPVGIDSETPTPRKITLTRATLNGGHAAIVVNPEASDAALACFALAQLRAVDDMLTVMTGAGDSSFDVTPMDLSFALKDLLMPAIEALREVDHRAGGDQ